MLLWAIVAAVLLPHQALCSPRVDPNVLSEMEANRQVNVMLRFKGKDPADIRQEFRKLEFTSREEKLETMYTMLKENADRGQARVMDMLEKRKITDPDCQYRQLWITTSIAAYNMNKELLDTLVKEYPEIDTIEKMHIIPREPPILIEASEAELNAEQHGRSPNWAFDRIQTAAAHHAGCRGDGVVVSNIDTGVFWNHEALKSQYRGSENNHDYNWFDPAQGSLTPVDTDGHGTHTMGVICGGRRSIGHAPRAKWISCRADTGAGYDNAVLEACGQWILCPTDTTGGNPDCSKAPHIVSNSWGPESFTDPFFLDVIETWTAAGIASFWAIGNNGKPGECSTAEVPGVWPQVFGVGSTNASDQLSAWSGTGPGPLNNPKPNVVAPGEKILTSHNNSTTGYAVASGTSFSCPCAAALGALLLSVRPGLSPADLYKIIEQGSDPHPPSTICTPTDTTEFNNQYGHGRVNARKSCMIARQYSHQNHNHHKINHANHMHGN